MKSFYTVVALTAALTSVSLSISIEQLYTGNKILISLLVVGHIHFKDLDVKQKL